MWSDIDIIAEELCDLYPDIEPQNILFTDLKNKIITLKDFADNPNNCNEKILEAIQQKWIDEQ